jgi:polyhydroxybutyrate depolymerase
VIEDIPNTSLIDLSTVQRFTYEPCDESSVVELLKIDGGGHQWPGTDALFGGIGSINRDIDASQEIWNFFSQFQCPSDVSTEEIANENNISIFPNPSTDVVNIQFANDQQPEILIIYNSQGQIVFQENIPQDQTKIQISTTALAPGIYFIKDTAVRLVVE